MKKYRVKVIHLSHTDMGYKDTQIKIKRIQSKNLLNVIKNISKYNDFAWNIESFGTLYDFLQEYPKQEEALVKLIKEKKIGMSTNFWNYTKIGSPFLIGKAFKKVSDFAKKHNLEKYAQSFITNDINGYSKEWAVKAYDSGTKNMFFGLHWSHGYYPAWKKQEPFYWDLGNSKKILVWIGDQYAVGNNFGIVPGPISDYISSDGRTAGNNEKDQIALANVRIQDLLKQLKKDKYSFNTIPITVLGTGSDNDPINFDIQERVKKLSKEWKKYGIEEISICTLQEFFDDVNKQKNTNIPVYKGEWPDWWSDGAASNPFALKAFKEAQRSYETLLRLGSKEVASIEDNLLLYSEHTYGTEWSTFKPYSFYNKQTEELKKSYALRGLEEVKYLIDKKLNWSSPKIKSNKKIHLEIINPTKAFVEKRVNLKRYIGAKEHSQILSRNIVIIDSKGTKIPFSLEILEHPVVASWSEKDIILHVSLKPNETKKITIDIENSTPIIPEIANQYATSMGRMQDDIINIKNKNNGITYYDGVLKTKHSQMIFDKNGLKEFKYLNIVLDKEFNVFRPIRYIDKQKNDYKVQYKTRGDMSRNIISNNSVREEAKYINHQIKISDDKQNTEVLINYELGGCGFIRTRYKISNHDKLVHLSLEMLKLPTWSNETTFLSMPKQKYQIEYGTLYYVNKDQLPGTLLNYHSLNEGLVYDSFKVNHMDTSLVYTGPIIYSQFRLAKDPEIKSEKFDEHYAIITTNNWETNFSVDQGGFNEFNFVLSPNTKKTNLAEELFAQAIDPLVIRKD